MTIKSILKMAMITAGAMFALNYLAGTNATARQLIRGKSVSPVVGETGNTAMFV